MPAPDVVLGSASRKLKKAPSNDWINGFDAGFDAGAALMDEFKNTADLLVERLVEISSAGQRVRELCRFADSTIRDEIYRKWKYTKERT